MGRQLDLFVEVRTEGELQAERCAAKAEDLGWDSDGATDFVLDYLRQHGETSGEVIVTEAKKIYKPHDDRAFGAVFSRLARHGKIVKCGYVPRLKGHGTAGGLVWRIAEGSDENATSK